MRWIDQPRSASQLKARILSHGLSFTPAAIQHARSCGAKGLQRVYNAPANAPYGAPQELLITDPGGYEVCVSAVAPVPGREPLTVDVVDDTLTLAADPAAMGGVEIRYVPEPDYYKESLPSGQAITRVVSACGVTEMNIWPWHDCAIGPLCRFCGINSVYRATGASDLLTARGLGAGREERLDAWLLDLATAIKIALDDRTYADELFPVIISGNLPNPALDRQAELYAAIAQVTSPLVAGRTGQEGLVAITAPPNDLGLLKLQHDAGITTMAINLEAFSPDVFRLECPGKHRMGRDMYIAALTASVEVFGVGRAWSNFVLGLEPVEALLEGCLELARAGIVAGASVLHFDEGAAVRGKGPPSYDEVIRFYGQLAEIYRNHDLRPYFSRLALRSSIANEAFEGKL